MKSKNWPYYSNEEIKKVVKVLKSGKVNYWTGNECSNFEKLFAQKFNLNHCIAVANGTVALEAALKCLNLKKYDESRIETLIRTSTNEGLVYIKRLGAVIGTAGGLMIWKPIICLISTSTVLLSLYILDLFIHKTKY